MKKTIRKMTALLTTSILVPQLMISNALASNQTVDLEQRLKVREQFYTTFLATERDMNDIAKNDALQVWYTVKARELRLPRLRMVPVQALNSYVMSQKVIDWAGHYQMTGQFDKVASVLGSYYLMLAAYINEVATDPRLDTTMTKVKRLAQELAPTSITEAQAAYACLSKNAASIGKGVSSSALGGLAQKCLNAGNLPAMKNLIQDALKNKYFKGSNQVLSLTGLIEGNQIEQLLENYYDAEFIHYMAPMTKSVIEKYGPLSVDDFKEKMTDKSVALTDFFTKADGFPESAREHKVWDRIKTNNGKKNIYGDVFHAIENAQQSIFIDVFFLGGSIGATLAKRIIEKVQENKNLWVYILNDRNNPLGYDAEMKPVFNYLRAYAEKFAEDRIVLMVPQVDLKRTAFPHIADLILKDATLQSAISKAQQANLISQLSFYPKGKSDHSKVIVVDGLDKTKGIAFVGSKNYTDSSGGVAYDEVTKIQGPAVPVILDSYYHDLRIAMRLLQQTAPKYFEDLHAKNIKVDDEDVDSQIRSILSRVDVLNRFGGPKSLDLKWPAAGSTPVMIGENNAFGTIRTALPQDIAAIRSAEKQIIISEQFIYEPSVVRALKEQVDAKPDLRVYIVLADMADHLNKMKEFSHIPNVSFIDEFVKDPTSKIQVKWKKVPALDLEALRAIKTSHGLGYAPEYHLKSISVDGVLASQAAQCSDPQRLATSVATEKLPLLISGSANKDVMTMTGGFREFQVVVYDRQATIQHDCQFWSRWNDKDQTEAVQLQSMNLPANLKAKGLDESRFNQLVRDIVHGAYNIVSGYFN